MNNNPEVQEIMKTFSERPELETFFRNFRSLPAESQQNILTAFRQNGKTFDALMSALVEEMTTGTGNPIS